MNRSKIIIIIKVLSLLFIAGAANGVMDTLQFHYSGSVFSNPDMFDQEWWNPKISFKGKYKDWDNGHKEEAFFLSKTVLVFITDAWHFFQFIMLACYRTIIVILGFNVFRLFEKKWLNYLGWIGVWLLLIPVFSTGFSLFYYKILI